MAQAFRNEMVEEEEEAVSRKVQLLEVSENITSFLR